MSFFDKFKRSCGRLAAAIKPNTTGKPVISRLGDAYRVRSHESWCVPDLETMREIEGREMLSKQEAVLWVATADAIDLGEAAPPTTTTTEQAERAGANPFNWVGNNAPPELLKLAGERARERRSKKIESPIDYATKIFPRGSPWPPRPRNVARPPLPVVLAVVPNDDGESSPAPARPSAPLGFYSPASTTAEDEDKDDYPERPTRPSNPVGRSDDEESVSSACPSPSSRGSFPLGRNDDASPSPNANGHQSAGELDSSSWSSSTSGEIATPRGGRRPRPVYNEVIGGDFGPTPCPGQQAKEWNTFTEGFDDEEFDLSGARQRLFQVELGLVTSTAPVPAIASAAPATPPPRTEFELVRLEYELAVIEAELELELPSPTEAEEDRALARRMFHWPTPFPFASDRQVRDDFNWSLQFPEVRRVLTYE